MKPTIVALLLCSLVAAETLPDAPSVSRASSTQAHTPKAHVEDAHGRIYWNTADRSFAERHRKAIIWGGVGIGAAIGLAAGLITKGVNCPQHEYEGHPYIGRSPGCPKDEPGEKR